MKLSRCFLGVGIRAAALVVLGLPLLVSMARGQEALTRLAGVGPWPVVSGLIGYGNRLWLVNSVKGRNHNSADVYSYDPARGNLRYERHLFSQDAGKPLVVRGLLYWPFEDGRTSLGWGDFMVTDGTRWQIGTLPSAEIFHVHAMAKVGSRLVAATSAWRAGLQVSGDGGRSWRAAYDHPTPERKVSRITDLIEVNGQLLAYMTSRDRQLVLVLDGDVVAELTGWPKDAPLRGWTRFGDQIYGLVRTEDGTAVWRSDGVAVERVSPSRSGWWPHALAAGEDALWAISNEGGGGILWRSSDGRDWDRFRVIQDGRPSDVTVHDGWVFVGGTGDNGQGLLWGEPGVERRIIYEPFGQERLDYWSRTWPSQKDRADLLEQLKRALGDPDSYPDYGEALRDLVFEFARQVPAPETWRALLDRGDHSPWPPVSQTHFSDGSAITAATLGRWILLWGMAVAGQGEVPQAWLNEAWVTPANPAEKYYATAPAAIWTAGEIGQVGAPTISALIGRLDRQDDPLWLTGDVVGALTALTGERFGYDKSAWRDWWNDVRADWPQ